MKQIKTASNDVVVAEIPKSAYDFWLSFDAVCFKTSTGYDWVKGRDCFIENYTKTLQYTSKIIGKLSELSEEECSRFVFEYSSKTNTFDKSGFQNYLYTSSVWSFSKFKFTAKESLISLLQSNGVNTSKSDELLIIEIL